MRTNVTRRILLCREIHDRWEEYILYAMSIGVARANAEYLVADAFYAAFLAYKQIDSARPLMPYMRRVIHNLRIDQARHARFETQTDILGSAEPASLDESLEQNRDRQERQRVVRGALRALPPKFAWPLRHAARWRSFEDGARRLNIPLNTFKSRYSRGLKLLRRRIAQRALTSCLLA